MVVSGRTPTALPDTRRPPREEAAGRDWAAARTTVSCRGTDQRSSEARSINRSGRGHSRSLYLVLGDGLILAASPSQLTLGVELPNFLDQDVLALSSSPNCAQPPSHQKRDRVEIARLCLLLSARLFSTRANQKHHSLFATAPGGVTLQVITRTHRSSESNILWC